MNNLEKLKSAFVSALNLSEEVDVTALRFNEYAEWDSIAHMALIAHLDETFDLMMDTEDIIDLSSFDKAIEILKKYKVDFA